MAVSVAEFGRLQLLRFAVERPQPGDRFTWRPGDIQVVAPEDSQTSVQTQRGMDLGAAPPVTAEGFSQAWHDAVTRNAPLVNKLQDAYTEALRKQVARAAKNLEDRAHVYSVVTAAGEPTWAIPNQDEIYEKLIAEAELKEGTDPWRVKISNTVVHDVAVALGLSFDVTNPLLHDAFKQFGQKITNIAEAQRGKIMGLIQRGYDEGLSVPDTAKLLLNEGGIDSMMRATRIARSEFIGGVNGGSLAMAGTVGVKAKTWLATNDNHTREWHAEADGQTVPLNQAFDVDGEAMLFPGDPNGSAENVVNCRCTLVYGDSMNPPPTPIQTQFGPGSPFAPGGWNPNLAQISENLPGLFPEAEFPVPADFEAIEANTVGNELKVGDYTLRRGKVVRVVANEKSAPMGKVEIHKIRAVDAEGNEVNLLPLSDYPKISGEPEVKLFRQATDSSIVQSESWDTATRKFFYDYQDEGARANEALRAGEAVDASDQEMVAALDKAIASSRATEDISLTRYSDASLFGGKPPVAGENFLDKGFVSTSKDPELFRDISSENAQAMSELTGEPAEKIYEIRIQVPEGSPAFDISANSDDKAFASMKEVLLPRGSTFSVESVDGNAVTLRYAPPAPAPAMAEGLTPGGVGVQPYALEKTQASEWTANIGDRTVSIPIDKSLGWSEDFMAKRADAIAQELSKLSPQQLDKISHVATKAGANPEDGLLAEKYGIKTFKSAANYKDGQLTFYNGKFSPGAIQHEAGHAIGADGQLEADVIGVPDAWKIAYQGGPVEPATWAQAAVDDSKLNLSGLKVSGKKSSIFTPTPGSIGVTKYGETLINEDWAEAIRLYKSGIKLTDGTTVPFADVFPNRAKILDELFGKIEGKLPLPEVAPKVEQVAVQAETQIPDFGPLAPGKAAGGSTGAKYATSTSGEEYVAKAYSGNMDRVATEALSNKIYQDLGVNVPQGGVGEMGGDRVFAAKVAPGATQDSAFSVAQRERLAQDYVSHAYLANWDFVGLEQDNILWNGLEPTYLDQGGTLFYRAQGSLKDFSSTEVKELDSLLKGQAKGFPVTEQDIAQQAAKLGQIMTDAKIDALVDSADFSPEMAAKVRTALKGRAQYLRDYADGHGIKLSPEPAPILPPAPLVSPPAGPSPLGLVESNAPSAPAWEELKAGDQIQYLGKTQTLGSKPGKLAWETDEGGYILKSAYDSGIFKVAPKIGAEAAGSVDYDQLLAEAVEKGDISKAESDKIYEGILSGDLPSEVEVKSAIDSFAKPLPSVTEDLITVESPGGLSVGDTVYSPEGQLLGKTVSYDEESGDLTFHAPDGKTEAWATKFDPVAVSANDTVSWSTGKIDEVLGKSVPGEARTAYQVGDMEFPSDMPTGTVFEDQYGKQYKILTKEPDGSIQYEQVADLTDKSPHWLKKNEMEPWKIVSLPGEAAPEAATAVPTLPPAHDVIQVSDFVDNLSSTQWGASADEKAMTKYAKYANKLKGDQALIVSKDDTGGVVGLTRYNPEALAPDTLSVNTYLLNEGNREKVLQDVLKQAQSLGKQKVELVQVGEHEDWLTSLGFKTETDGKSYIASLSDVKLQQPLVQQITPVEKWAAKDFAENLATHEYAPGTKGVVEKYVKYQAGLKVPRQLLVVRNEQGQIESVLAYVEPTAESTTLEVNAFVLSDAGVDRAVTEAAKLAAEEGKPALAIREAEKGIYDASGKLEALGFKQSGKTYGIQLKDLDVQHGGTLTETLSTTEPMLSHVDAASWLIKQPPTGNKIELLDKVDTGEIQTQSQLEAAFEEALTAVPQKVPSLEKVATGSKEIQDFIAGLPNDKGASSLADQADTLTQKIPKYGYGKSLYIARNAEGEIEGIFTIDNAAYDIGNFLHLRPVVIAPGRAQEVANLAMKQAAEEGKGVWVTGAQDELANALTEMGFKADKKAYESGLKLISTSVKKAAKSLPDVTVAAPKVEVLDIGQYGSTVLDGSDGLEAFQSSGLTGKGWADGPMWSSAKNGDKLLSVTDAQGDIIGQAKLSEPISEKSKGFLTFSARTAPENSEALEATLRKASEEAAKEGKGLALVYKGQAQREALEKLGFHAPTDSAHQAAQYAEWRQLTAEEVKKLAEGQKLPAFEVPKVTPKAAESTQAGFKKELLGKAVPAPSWPLKANEIRGPRGNYAQNLLSKTTDWIDNVRSGVGSALQRYSGSYAYDLNARLRLGRTLSSTDMREVKALDAAMENKIPLPDGFVTWRTQQLDFRISHDIQEFVNAAKAEGGDYMDGLMAWVRTKYKVGMEADTAGQYWSSTVTPEAYGDYDQKMIFEIIPKRGIYMKNKSGISTEDEFLLPKDARFIVKGIDVAKTKKGSRCIFLQLEQVY